MEEFENYRKDLAEELKDTPKEDRKNLLEIKKQDPKYVEAKGLREAKRGTYRLSHTEDLKNLDDINEISSWIKTEVLDFTNTRAEYMTGYQLEEVFQEIAKVLAQRMKVRPIELDRENLTYNEERSFFDDELDLEGTTKGILQLMGEEIFSYSSRGDGSGFSIDNWNGNSLESATTKLVELLKPAGE